MSATGSGTPATRVAGHADAAAIGRLLHDFNTEYDDPTPGPTELAERVRALFDTGDTVVVLVGDGPEGLALMRFRRSLWTPNLECYLAELYVVPARRGEGLGRALMDAAMDESRRRGADRMELGTSEDDEVARHLYEKLGFTNRERPPDGPIMYFYERDL